MLSVDLNTHKQNPLILIVDDVRANQQLLARLFKDDYRIKVASNGQRALEIAKSHSGIALILLDIFMPGMDGYEVCIKLKADSQTRDIPIIFITAADDDASESYGLKIGAIDYITKPIKPVTTKLRVQKNIALSQYQERLSFSMEIIKHSKEAILIADEKYRIIDINQAFSKITGYDRKDVIGKNYHCFSSNSEFGSKFQAIWEEIHQHGYWAGELWNKKSTGESYPEWVTILGITSPRSNLKHYVRIASDITLLKQREYELEHMAKFDLLTGVPNRTSLLLQMQQAIAKSQREQKLLGICYLDLDGFKPVNDELGHQTGDLVLIEIAQRIQNAIRKEDTLARLGGDEFVILLVDLEDHDAYKASIERILEAIHKPIFINAKRILLGASIGITLFPLDDEESDTLLRHADHAMYAAKQAGKNCYHLYNPELDIEIRNQNESLKRLHQGLQHNEFELFYQPKIKMRTGKLVGVEALIRWNHPERGLLNPGDFLPQIEHSDLIIELGDWVIISALSQLEIWSKLGFEIPISINIAGRQLQHQDFIHKLDAALKQFTHINHELLELEILETSALKIEESAQIILDIKNKLGIPFAIDDFGTGYSSLTYLKALPVLALKIDQTFVCNMLNDPSDQAIVEGIIALADSFNLLTVAEGVETHKHFELLLKLGCEVGQGYGIARPMSAHKFIEWQQNRSPSNYAAAI